MLFFLARFCEINPYHKRSIMKSRKYNIDKTGQLNWEGKTIVIADDVRVNFMLLRIMFEQTKAQIIWVQNGEEAVELCTNGKKIDLVVMDYMMPVVDGIEAALRIKAQRKYLPILFQSATPWLKDYVSNIPYPAIDYIEKPVRMTLLLERAAALMQ